MGSKEKRLAHNTLLIALSNMCTKFISFFMMPLYTSLLSTQEYGVADVVAMYTSLLAMGINLQLEQGVFRYLIESRGNVHKQTEYINSALWVTVGALCVFGLLAVPVLHWLNYKYAEYLIASVIISVLMSLLLQIPRGCGDNRGYALISCVTGSTGVILNVLLIAVAGWGVDGILHAGMIANVVGILLVILRTKLWKRVSICWFRKKAVKELLNYSLPMVPGTFMWWIINASDRLFINVVLGTSFNGIYAVANKFASTYTMGVNVFQTAWTESAAENIHDADRNRFYQGIFNTTLRIASSCYLGIVAIMPVVFKILVNENFGEAYLYVPILLIAAMLYAVSSFYGSVFLAFKKTTVVAGTTVFAAIINLVINLLFIQQMGLYATSISTALAYATIVLIRHRGIKKLTDISVDNRFVIRMSLAIAVALLGYYSDSIVLHRILPFFMIPYCYVENRQTIGALIKGICKKLGICNE